MGEPPWLKQAGGKWYHTDDYNSPNLSKASLGTFFSEVLKSGAYIGEVWPLNVNFSRSTVLVTVFMTEEMKAQIEANTKFKFRDPPKITLN